MISVVFVVGLVHLVAGQSCYSSNENPYLLFSSKTPYVSIRGDIREYDVPENCEAVSVWTLNRHGNRNPGDSVTIRMRAMAALKDDIIQSYENGTSELCAEDIEQLRPWVWNSTLDTTQSYLTGVGYEELYDIASRLREKYPHLLNGTDDDYYFRTTNEQRTITSTIAFLHGLSEGTNLNLTYDGPWERDDVIRPYENCQRYQEEVRGGEQVVTEIQDYYDTEEFRNVQSAVQQRLGISTQLDEEDVYAFFELCRFYRSWDMDLRSPWCALFTKADLEVLEYYDDVRHYHRNGYGSWVNVYLGRPVLGNLYQSFEDVVSGGGRNFVSYFTHDTMLEMTFCAMGLFRDPYVIRGATREPDRMWRVSNIGAFSTNLIAVLNRCTESGVQTHRVQLFINEQLTALCPLEGCSWENFRAFFQLHTNANLDFCSPDYPVLDQEVIIVDTPNIAEGDEEEDDEDDDDEDDDDEDDAEAVTDEDTGDDAFTVTGAVGLVLLSQVIAILR